MLTKLLCEFGATALMIIFGVGVHCDTVLKGTKYQGSGHMFAITTWSFGISVCLFVFGGAVCMNPAMVLAQCIVGLVPWSSCIPFNMSRTLSRGKIGPDPNDMGSGPLPISTRPRRPRRVLPTLVFAV